MVVLNIPTLGLFNNNIEFWFKFWTVQNNVHFIFQLCILSNLVIIWPVQFQIYGAAGDAPVSNGLLYAHVIYAAIWMLLDMEISLLTGLMTKFLKSHGKPPTSETTSTDNLLTISKKPSAGKNPHQVKRYYTEKNKLCKHISQSPRTKTKLEKSPSHAKVWTLKRMWDQVLEE